MGGNFKVSKTFDINTKPFPLISSDMYSVKIYVIVLWWVSQGGGGSQLPKGQTPPRPKKKPWIWCKFPNTILTSHTHMHVVVTRYKIVVHKTHGRVHPN